MPYWGTYTMTKSALDAIARTYAAETETTPLRVNLFTPGRVRTRMLPTAFPGLDPDDHRVPEGSREKIVDLCMPDVHGRPGRSTPIRSGRWLELSAACVTRSLTGASRTMSTITATAMVPAATKNASARLVPRPPPCQSTSQRLARTAADQSCWRCPSRSYWRP